MTTPLSFHSGSRVWHYMEDSKFNMDYNALENFFNEKAREEGLLSEKQYIHIKEIEISSKERILQLSTELYRLLEN